MSIFFHRSVSVSVFLVLGTSLALVGQNNREEMEADRVSSLKRIEATNAILSETRKDRVTKLGQLRAISRQIEQRRELVKMIREELAMIDTDIHSTLEIIASLNRDLDNLKKEYAEILYLSSKSNASGQLQKLSYLFASESFNQFLSRLHYLQLYNETRTYQISQIEKVMTELSTRKNDLEARKVERNALLATTQKQETDLSTLRKEQGKLVSELSSKEKELKDQLNNDKKMLAELNRLIALTVTEDMEEIRLKSEDAGQLMLMPAAKKVSENFMENKKGLPWPVEEGFISRKFGKQMHTVFDDVWVDNPGIDISTREEALVFAVFEGEVSAVAKVPGMHYMVMIQHGEYFTVYTKIKDVAVKQGQTVKAGTAIARVATNLDGIPELQFQIWHSFKKLDPEEWLAK